MHGDSMSPDVSPRKTVFDFVVAYNEHVRCTVSCVSSMVGGPARDRRFEAAKESWPRGGGGGVGTDCESTKHKVKLLIMFMLKDSHSDRSVFILKFLGSY